MITCIVYYPSKQVDCLHGESERTYLDTTIGVDYYEVCCLYMTTESGVVQSVPAKGVSCPQVHAISKILDDKSMQRACMIASVWVSQKPFLAVLNATTYGSWLSLQRCIPAYGLGAFSQRGNDSKRESF